jgi:hypothetical protein
MAKPKADKNESPRERFLRLAPPRVDAALKKISLLGNLSRSGYEYEPHEVKQMIAALEEAVAEVKQKFTRKSTGKSVGFSFNNSRRPAAAAMS